MNSAGDFLRIVGSTTKALVKQIRFFSILEPVFEWISTQIRSLYKEYKFYGPEVEFGKCFIKVMHVNYPDLMRRLHIRHIIKSARGLYEMITTNINNFFSGTGFHSFDAFDSERIHEKIVQMTSDEIPDSKEDVLRVLQQNRQNLVRNANPPNVLSSSPSVLPFLHRPLPIYYYQIPSNYNKKRTRRMAKPDFDPYLEEDAVASHMLKPILKDSQRGKQDDMNTTILMEYQNENLLDDSDYIDPDANIKLATKSAEEEAEELFNLEPVIMEGLGYDGKTIKKYTMLYCAKEYMKDVLRRFTDNVLLD